jgi:RNA-directed DNA polymerase
VNAGESDRGNTINNILIHRIAADPTLEAAYAWVCHRRQHHHFNSDIWPLRRHWAERKPQIQALLLSGQYRFREQRLITTPDDEIEYWCAEDALVLKAISLVLTEEWLPLLSPQCFHIAGRGGLKGALRQVADQVGGDDYFYRTDVKNYYASINHGLLMAQVEQYVQDPLVLSLLWGYLKRVVNQGGW